MRLTPQPPPLRSPRASAGAPGLFYHSHHPSGPPMDKFIERRNIANYSNQLMGETDPIKRKLLQDLMVEEMVKLASPAKDNR
jgi:hypothetical protein